MTGQGVSRFRVIDDRRYVWMTTQVGSNLGGRWVEERLAPGVNIVNVPMDNVRTIQESAGEGSMLKGPGYVRVRGARTY